jgi:hypothetical protein
MTAMKEQPKQSAARSDVEEIIDRLREDNERGEVQGLVLAYFVEDGVKTSIVGRFNPILMSGHLELLKADLIRAEMGEVDRRKALH